MLSSAASAASPSGGLASSQSLLLPPSAGVNTHGSLLVRGHGPPLVAAATRPSSIPVSRTSALPFPPRRPDPDGVNGPSSLFGMGGVGGFGSLGGPGRLGGMGYRCASARRTPTSRFSAYSSNDDDFRSYNFPGPIPNTIPSFVFHHHGAPPPPGVSVPSLAAGYHHGPASVASASAFAALPLCPLSHEDISASSALDLTMSFPPHDGVPTAVPLAPPPAPPHVPAPPPGLASGGVTSPPPVPSPPLVVTPLAFLFGLRKLSSFPPSRIQKHTWMFMT